MIFFCFMVKWFLSHNDKYWLIKETFLHVQLLWRASSQAHRKGIHLIIPFSVKGDKTFPPLSTCLSTLCSLFLLTLLSGLYSVSCSVNIICRCGADRLKSRAFLLSCRWLMWLRQEAATIPLHWLRSTTAPCFLLNTNSLSLPRLHSSPE